MGGFFQGLFATDFMPHIMCLRTPGVIRLHVVSDLLIAAAYLIIPIGLLRVMHMRKDLAFDWMFVLFAGFILSCGATHVLAVVTLWTPFYRFEGLIKAVTAGLSLATAVLLIHLIPQITRLPSPDQWRRAEERFRLVVESVPNAMVMINRAGEIALVNRQTEQWFGYAREELLGQAVEVLLPERFRNAHPAHRIDFFAKLGAPGPSQGTMGLGRELFARRKDGSEFPIEVGLNPLETEEGPMVLSAIVDATGRKRVEENIREFNRILELQVSERTAALREANRDLEEFAYVASHDLKAPLRVIDNCSRWIEEDLEEHLSGETRDNMNLLRKRVRRMEKLLDDLLDYARIGRVTDSRYAETIAGDAMIRNVLELLAPGSFAVNVSARFAAIEVRAMPLQQVLLNLIGNAIKHHDKGTGRIEVTVEDRGPLYEFAVSDDGPGIPAQFHNQVFKMFQTLRPRDQVEGSGMGLAMARRYVEVSGGKLDLESEEGKGSTFRFTWPKQPRENNHHQDSNILKGRVAEPNGNAVSQTL